MSSASHVVGLFDQIEDAERAVKDLVHAGFDHRKVSLLAADPHGKLFRRHPEPTEGNMAGSGASVGITSGTIIGGILGLLIGAGLMFVPAGFIAAGPIAGLIAGGFAGAATGGVIGALMGIGIPEKDADIYAEAIRRGSCLVTIDAREADIHRAHEILNGDGAVDIRDRERRYQKEGFITYDPTAPFFNAEEVHRERERIAHESGAVDEAQADQERIFGLGEGTGPGAYDERGADILPQ